MLVYDVVDEVVVMEGRKSLELGVPVLPGWRGEARAFPKPPGASYG